jgi:lincosamide nucleotidyltransferase A/C/D/E
MEMSDVLDVLTAFEDAGIRHWIAGGWGVDALAGRQTRPHQDVDLAFDASAEEAALAVLAKLGYAVRTDQRPARVELAAPGDLVVDLHPVRFGPDGAGLQADLADGCFRYPPSAFTSGSLGGRRVGCLSAEQQLAFRQGYPLREVDHLDISLLQGMARS